MAPCGLPGTLQILNKNPPGNFACSGQNSTAIINTRARSPPTFPGLSSGSSIIIWIIIVALGVVLLILLVWVLHFCSCSPLSPIGKPQRLEQQRQKAQKAQKNRRSQTPWMRREASCDLYSDWLRDGYANYPMNQQQRHPYIYPAQIYRTVAQQNESTQQGDQGRVLTPAANAHINAMAEVMRVAPENCDRLNHTLLRSGIQMRQSVPTGDLSLDVLWGPCPDYAIDAPGFPEQVARGSRRDEHSGYDHSERPETPLPAYEMDGQFNGSGNN